MNKVPQPDQLRNSTLIEHGLYQRHKIVFTPTIDNNNEYSGPKIKVRN